MCKVELKGVEKRFLFASNQELRVIAGLDLEIKDEHFVSLVGMSGCGKTTILKLIAGLLEVTAGKIVVEHNINGPGGRIGFVFQDSALLPWRNIYKNVSLPLELCGSRLIGKAEKDKIEHLLSLTDLWQYRKSMPYEISGGMRQKVSLARALITEPGLLLMDEPFSSLDEFTRERLNDEMLDILRKFRSTVIMVTHSVKEAIYLSDEVVVLSDKPAIVRKVFNTEKANLHDGSFQFCLKEIRNLLGVKSYI